jgi:polar amino acid transport system substrate-binding protein
MHELKIGKTDLTIMFKYPELESYVTYISPLPPLKNVIIGRNSNYFPTIESLQGKVVAYLRGAKLSDVVDNDSSISRQEVMDFNQGLILLQKGRVDAIIGPLAPIKSAAKILSLKDDFFGEPLVVSQRTPWLQVSNKSLDKVSVEQLKANLVSLIEQGELAQLKMKYQ